MSTTLLNVLTSILSLKFRLNNLRWSHTWFCDCFSPVALRALSQIKRVPFSQKEIKMPDEDHNHFALRSLQQYLFNRNMYLSCL